MCYFDYKHKIKFFKKIFFLLNLFIFNFNFCKKIFKCSFFNAKEYFYIHRTWTNFKVIYKVIINNYDVNFNPKFLNYDFDYLFYTNNIENYLQNNNSIWQYLNIPENIKKLTPSKQNRYLKINAHKYLPSIYNFSIYIDGNIIIVNDINLLLKELNSKYGNFNFYIPIHPDRNCIYKEAKVVLKLKKDRAKIVNPQIKKIKKDGFPKYYGLSENNILIRNHKDLSIIELMNEWWKIISNGSKRDQLSLMYILWKYNFTNFSFIERKLIEKYFKIKRKHKKYIF